jgi:hypothetical protein
LGWQGNFDRLVLEASEQVKALPELSVGAEADPRELSARPFTGTAVPCAVMSPTQWIWLSAVSLATFVVAVSMQPLLVPAYDPLRQQISEYVHTSAGPVMVAGFLAWSISLAALGALLSSERRPGLRWLSSAQVASLFCAAAGAALLACFATDRGARVRGVVTRGTTHGQIHDLASGVVTVGILLAALTGAAQSRGWLRTATVALLGVGLASSLAFLAIGDPLPGLRQRVLVASACLWQLTWLIALSRGQASTWPRSSEGSRCSTS